MSTLLLHPKTVMATEAHHVLGDISRDEPDFAWVTHYVDDPEWGDCYVGQWETGFGFINVRFPIHTTRPLSWVEKKFLADHVTVVV